MKRLIANLVLLVMTSTTFAAGKVETMKLDLFRCISEESARACDRSCERKGKIIFKVDEQNERVSILYENGDVSKRSGSSFTLFDARNWTTKSFRTKFLSGYIQKEEKMSDGRYLLLVSFRTHTGALWTDPQIPRPQYECAK